jgi:hypothetical protein
MLNVWTATEDEIMIKNSTRNRYDKGHYAGFTTEAANTEQRANKHNQEHDNTVKVTTGAYTD